MQCATPTYLCREFLFGVTNFCFGETFVGQIIVSLSLPGFVTSPGDFSVQRAQLLVSNTVYRLMGSRVASWLLQQTIFLFLRLIKSPA